MDATFGMGVYIRIFPLKVVIIICLPYENIWMIFQESIPLLRLWKAFMIESAKGLKVDHLS